MERESFVFYRSFWESIKVLPRDIQGEVLTAIVEYGLYGETTENPKPIAGAILTLVKPIIEANNQKFLNGLKGGAPKGNQNAKKNQPKNNQNQPKNNQNQPKNNQNQPKNNQNQPNVNVNDNVNVDKYTPKPPNREFGVDFQNEQEIDFPENENLDLLEENMKHLKTEKEKPKDISAGGGGADKIDFEKLLETINKYTGREFKVINEAVRKKYRARLKEGYTKEDIFEAIQNAVREKYHIETGMKFLRPEFFSRADKIDLYKNKAKQNENSFTATPPRPKREVGDL